MKRARAWVFAALVTLAAHCSDGARLRENANNRALVVVNDCTSDCGAAPAAVPATTERQQQDAVPEFVPTHEWKDILPNQALPPGLYIRVNLETGKKEAKLLN